MTEQPPQRKRGGRPRLDAPSPIDIHVGSRVKQRRVGLGLSQDRLAKEIGLTFQQVQKYERGTNRIGASRLHDLSRVLNVPVSYFFEDMVSVGKQGFGEREQEPFGPDPMGKRETLELIRAYYRITDTQVRRRIFEMVKAVASVSQQNENSN